MFPPPLIDAAIKLLDQLRSEQLKFAAAESCTGGLLTGLLTEIPGSSEVVERGFVTYSNEAKMSMLGISADLLQAHGAVSAPVARAMAQGALEHSLADVAVAITGVAGPGGGTPVKPVGLVYIAALRSGAPVQEQELRLGDISRSMIRGRSIEAALSLIGRALTA